MNIKKLLISLFLIISLIAVSGCSSGEITTTSETEDIAFSSGANETTSLYEADNLPQLDFGGEDFTIFVEDYGGYSAVDFFVEQAVGDIVEDSVYLRNGAVSDRLNLNIKWQSFTHKWDDRSNYINSLLSSVLAGNSAYDLITGLGYFIPGFVTDGILSDMSTLPYIDIDKPWWAKSFMEKSAVDGKYYFVTGDASLGLIKNMFCIYENLELYETLGIKEYPYQLVYDGKWTLDKLSEISRSQYGDLNGNSKVDNDDRFGLLVNSGNHITGFLEALGVKIVEFIDNEAHFVFGNDHNVNVVQKLNEVVMNTNGIYFDKKGEAETAYNSIFRNGNVVFATGWLMHADSYRDLDFDYGVLPYPKWVESQNDYATTVLTSYSVLSIPTDCKEVDRAAAVVEALGSESYRNVTPAYFETALKVKYARDNDSSKMFDIIKAGVSFDFGYIYTIAMDGVSDQFKGAIVQNDPNWASHVASFETHMKDKLTVLVNSIKEIDK